MSEELKKALKRLLGERARFGLPLSAHTTWGVGGLAYAVCTVQSREEAARVLAAVGEAGLPHKALGRGSNLLVADRGYPGVLLRLAGPLARLRREGDQFLAEGGADLPAAVRFATRLGLSGLEWAAGIPATVGGAVATNAGAFGADLAGLAVALTLLMPDGTVRQVAGAEVPHAYRRRELPAGSVVLAARLAFTRSDPDTVAARAAEYLKRRKATQPLGSRTAGSVFKNPPGDHAGRLIEAAGCKGLTVGDAVVSERHANFIVNRGRARAADIQGLIQLVRQRVADAFGVLLEPEVEVVGDV